MQQINEEFLAEYAQALAFIGNSLLDTMSHTTTIGIDPKFWEVFPDFGNADVVQKIKACKDYSVAAQERQARGVDVATEVSVEFTFLFVGPPRPATAPWESSYLGEGPSVGFGKAAMQMQQMLREAGLRIEYDSNQYADHMGIELLYASALCARIVEGEDGAAGLDAVAGFIKQHPARWIDSLANRVAVARPSGYFAHLLPLSNAILSVLL